MNTDNWREEFKEWLNGDSKNLRYSSVWYESKLDGYAATLKGKDAEIASLRAELEGLKEQIPGLLKEQRELCAEAVELNDDGTPNGCVYVDRNSILSAPSPQIKQG